MYRMRVNYWRISLRNNSRRKCRKIVKYVSITHSERNIWNGPIVATAISRKKRKPVQRPQTTRSAPGHPRHQTSLCDFFLWHFVKDNVYVPTLPKTLPELRESASTQQLGTSPKALLGRVWEYRLHISRVTRGAHTE